MMTDGQAQLQMNNRDKGATGITFINQRLSGEVFSVSLLTGSSSNNNKLTTTMLISDPMVPSLKRLETCVRKASEQNINILLASCCSGRDSRILFQWHPRRMFILAEI